MKKLLAVVLAWTLALQATIVPCFALTETDEYDELYEVESSWRATPTSSGVDMHDFLVDFYLSRDDNGASRMRVKETISATFPDLDSARGLMRIIPFTNQGGKNLTMASDKNLDLVATRNGQREPIAEITADDGYFKAYFGDANTYLHGEQVYTLEYEFENVITEFDDGEKAWQELYWDTNGNDWGNSFDSVTATVHMDQEIADEYLRENACYVGRYGENGSWRCTIETNSRNTEVTFYAEEINPYENLSFVLAFEPGTFVIADTQKSYSAILLFVAVAVTGGVILAVAISKYNKTSAKRNYYKSKFVKPEYAPMPEVTVAEMSENSFWTFAYRERVATLMELAVSGKVAIHKTTSDGVLHKKDVWSIEIVEDNFLPEQRDILKILNNSNDFKRGDIFELKENEYDTNAVLLLQDFGDQIEQRLEKLGLFEDDKKAKKSVTGRIFLITFIWELFAIICIVAIASLRASYREIVGEKAFIVAIGVLMFSVMVISMTLAAATQRYQRRTEKGLDAVRYLEGLRLYIKMAESERIKFLQSVDGADTTNQGVVKLYEKLLPYAVLFGLEKSWMHEMSKYYELDDISTPSWYVGAGAFVARDFSNAISEVSSLAGTSIAHSTTDHSSSSSSGFSSGGGGGFSGGGGGGGGGGTW